MVVPFESNAGPDAAGEQEQQWRRRTAARISTLTLRVFPS